jgi:hypothetical protein
MIDSNSSATTQYQLSGFITLDPILQDYSVCLRNKKKEVANFDHDWVTFNKRGLQKTTDEIMFSNITSTNAQILMYKQGYEKMGSDKE